MTIPFKETDCTVGGSSCGAWHEWYWDSVEADPDCMEEERDPKPIADYPFDGSGCAAPEACRLARRCRKGGGR